MEKSTFIDNAKGRAGILDSRPPLSYLHPTRKPSAKPHTAKTPNLPNRQKTSPMSPPFPKSETNLRFLNGGDMGEVLGGCGRFGGRGTPLSRGVPLPPRSSYTFFAFFGTKRRTLRGTTATSMSPQMPRSPSKFHTTSSGTSKRIVPLGKCAMLFCL